MTSAFVIQVHPQLQSDPNADTTALLRVLIHKIDNSTFGGDVPAVPQWAGPPRTIVHVQAILYASLASSLFSAFLAMLGKQWLNRYAFTGVGGSAVERSQNRQRKLDGIVTWYFDHVMESLPLILQFALLLLGCALSLYLWGIDTTVALVVLGVTSFGVACYAFIVIAGAVSASCPYQTPAAKFLRHLLSPIIKNSKFIGLVTKWWETLMGLEYCSLLLHTLLLPTFLAIDIYRLAQVMFRVLVAATHRVSGLFRGARRQYKPTAVVDLQCVTWVLQISLDKTIHLLALKLLATITTLANLDPALVPACFNILTACVAVPNGKVVVAQGSEELAAASALCCLRTLAHLGAADPESSVFRDVRRRYTRTFPFKTDFEGSPSYYHFSMMHSVFYPSRKRVYEGYLYRSKIQWKDYKLCSNPVVQLALFGYQRSGRLKVPRWILHFSLHHLSQDPLLSPTIVTDCLLIIAIDLGCNISNAATLDERYVDI